MTTPNPLPALDQDVEAEERTFRLWIPRVSSLLLVAAIGLTLTLLIVVGVPQWRKLQLINAVEALGGDVRTEFRGPEWLRNLVGGESRDLFHVVTEVNVLDDNAGDRVLVLAAGQPHLRNLSIASYGISGRGLQRLAEARRLRQLSIIYSGLTDETLQSLPDLPELEVLRLSGNPITGPGLEHLDRFPRLKQLDVLSCPVTDQGVWYLSLAAPHLERLDLGMTDISNVGLRHLERLEKLRSLDLYGTAVNDEAVPALIRIRSLRTVDLNHSNFTDDGVQALIDSCPDLEPVWTTGKPVDELAPSLSPLHLETGPD
jgi:hypothetical protein